jgi:hypothetical protein
MALALCPATRPSFSEPQFFRELGDQAKTQRTRVETKNTVSQMFIILIYGTVSLHLDRSSDKED